MKPFNLERAIAGDKIVTRDGRAVRYIGHAPELNAWRQVVCVVGGELLTYDSSGMNPGIRSGADLFMAPKLQNVWVNLRLNGTADHYDTEEEADYYFSTGNHLRLGNKAYKIEVEE